MFPGLIDKILLITILSSFLSPVSAQKSRTTEWVKSTRCFTGFSSRVIISQPEQ